MSKSKRNMTSGMLKLNFEDFVNNPSKISKEISQLLKIEKKRVEESIQKSLIKN